MEYRRGKIVDIKKVLEGLKSEYETYTMPMHKDVATYAFPNGGYFSDLHDPNTHGEKRTAEIYDSIPSIAIRVATSGIASGLTPQTSRWGNWKPEDKELLELTGVRAWSDEVTSKDFQALSRSNFYKEMQKSYAEAFAFGTTCVITDFHPQRWVHCKTLTIGEYYFLEDQYGDPNTLYREMWLRAVDIVNKFGIENASQKVKDAIKQNRGYEWFQVCHVIQPVFGFGQFEYEGIYFEKSADKPNDILMESGYFTKPFNIFRWHLIGSERWGRSPVMEALPDIKLLHTMYRDKLQALAFMIKPLMAVLDAAIKDDVIRAKPGDIIVLKQVPGFNGMPIDNISRAGEFPYAAVAQDMNEVRIRINSMLFGDLFQALSAFNPKTQTATEIAAIQDQNQRLLSPVIGNFISDLIIPQSERRFDIMYRNGAFSDPPDELLDEELSMEMTSSLSIIQQKISTVAMEQLLGFVNVLAQTNPAVIDKIDYEESIEDYAEAVNAPGNMIRSDEQVKEIRDGRQAEFERQKQLEEQSQSVRNLKELSQTDTGNVNALTDIMGV